MKPFNFRHVFEPSFFWLRLIGLWPETASYEFGVYSIYSLISVSLLIYFHTFLQFMGLFMEQLDLDSLAAALFVPGHMMAATKASVVLNKLPAIKRLVSRLDGPHLQPTDEAQNKIAETDFKLWTVLYRTVKIFITLAPFGWLFRPLMNGSYKKNVLPLFTWMPFDTTSTLVYQIAYVHQCLGLFYSATAVIHTDILSAGFTIYLGTQCNILCEKVRQMRNPIDLIRCVEHHQKILEFLSDFNDFVGKVFLAQLFATATTLALFLFKLSLTVPGSADYYTVALIGFAVPIELLLYCWFGTELEHRSSNIPLSIFESNWTGASSEFRKLLLIFLTRTQQPMTTTAFNLFPLSLRTFMTIMRTSYSYFALLHQLNNK